LFVSLSIIIKLAVYAIHEYLRTGELFLNTLSPHHIATPWQPFRAP